VICPDVGGGFGPRTNLYPEQVVVVWAARRLGRPVKWIADRSESFLADYQGRDNVADAALALDAQGRILGYEVEWFGNVGAHTVSFVPLSNGRRILSTVYKVPAVHAMMHAVLTNTVPTAPYRGAGRPEAIHMIERLLDMAARRMGIDRVEIRSRNVVTRDLLPWRNAMGLVYDSGDFAGYMARVLELADWSGFPARKHAAAARARLAGIGLANHVEAPVGMPAERAVVTVNGDDETIEVIVGTQSTGQGHETTFAQVIADQLDVPFEAVRIRSGDSAFVTLGGGTHSDRSMRLVGTLLVRASADILDQARELAAVLLEVAVADLVYEAGAFKVAGTDRALTLHEIARAASAASDGVASETAESRRIPADMRRALAVTKDFRGRIPAFPSGAAVCELEIDPETGAVDITRYTTVEDVGQAINPMIVQGQTHGGIAQGVGQALHEGVAHDPDNAQVLTGSFMDYGICRADDLPSFDLDHAEDPTEGNPLRVKGGGEGGIMPATAAVINALCDALADAGIDDLPMPATQAVIWSAMKKSRQAPNVTANETGEIAGEASTQ
jgi:carbon-monoxide dehydrogenase large subunit